MQGESYGHARRWADRFVPRQRRQLATLLGVPVDEVVIADTRTDIDGADVLIGPLRVGLRVRRSWALASYGPQPTIRSHKGRDGRNELDKVKAGTIDYMLLNYATAEASQDDSDDDAMLASFLIDLGPIREAARHDFAGVTTHERDGDRCTFVAIDLGSLTATYGPAVVARGATTTTTTTRTTYDPLTGGPCRTTTTTTTTTHSGDDGKLADLRRRVRMPNVATTSDAA